MNTKQKGFAFLAPLLPFLPGKDALIRIALYGAAIAMFGFWAYTKGASKEALKHAEFVGKQAVQSQKLLEARIEKVREVEVKYITKDRIIREKGETIVKEVPIYVTKADDSRCDINTGFVRSYNMSVANNLDSSAPSESDRTSAGVSLSAVAETNAYNLQLCHQWKERALSVIDAYNAAREATVQ